MKNVQLFGTHGYLRTSMDQVAEWCGVTKPLLYEYFGSKDGLFLATVEHARAELHAVVAASAQKVAAPAEALAAGLLAYFEFMDSRPHLLITLVREPAALPAATLEAIESARRDRGAPIAPVLSGIAPDLAPDVIAVYAEIVIGGCERLAIRRFYHQDMSTAAAARHMTSFTRLGLQTRSTAC